MYLHHEDVCAKLSGLLSGQLQIKQVLLRIFTIFLHVKLQPTVLLLAPLNRTK